MIFFHCHKVSFLFCTSGENFVLRATYRRVPKDTGRFTNMLPFFGTDYGLCTLIKPQVSFQCYPTLVKVIL